MPSRALFTDPSRSNSPTAGETARSSRPRPCECAQGCGRLPGSGSRVTRSWGSRWGVLWAGRWRRGREGLPVGVVSRRLCHAPSAGSPRSPAGRVITSPRRRLTLGSTCLLAAVGQTRSGSQALRWSSACADSPFSSSPCFTHSLGSAPTPELCVGWHCQPSNLPGPRRECCGGWNTPGAGHSVCVAGGGLWGALRDRLCPSFLCPRTLIFPL